MGVIKLKELYGAVEEMMKEKKPAFFEDKARQEEMIKLSSREQDLKMLATEGSPEAREFIRNKIYLILAGMKDVICPDNIDEIIGQYHVNYYENVFSGGEEDAVKTPVDREIEEYFYRYSISRYDNFDRKLMKLAQIVYQELYGYSLLDELIFESTFNEVACNRYDFIWIQYKGIKRRIPNKNFRFISESYYNRIIESRLTSTARVEMNAGEPVIYATLRNGFRVTALRPPISRYYVVNVRLFIYKNIEDEVRSKFMEEKMVKLVEILTGKGRRNVAIIGEQGSGKTTAADELIIKKLDDNLGIGLAENIHELNIYVSYHGKNTVELQYTRDFKPSDITEIFFRLNRDIVIYGEVRSPAEAFEMIKAMLRQARGSLFTFHTSSVRRMVHDLRQLLMQTGYYSDYREAQFDVADAVDIVIQLKLDRSTGERYVCRISEIEALDDDMNFRITDLFVFDKVKNKYLVNRAGVSRRMLESCLDYEMTPEDVDFVKSLFTINPGEENIFEYMQEGVCFV